MQVELTIDTLTYLHAAVKHQILEGEKFTSRVHHQDKCPHVNGVHWSGTRNRYIAKHLDEASGKSSYYHAKTLEAAIAFVETGARATEEVAGEARHESDDDGQSEDEGRVEDDGRVEGSEPEVKDDAGDEANDDESAAPDGFDRRESLAMSTAVFMS